MDVTDRLRHKRSGLQDRISEEDAGEQPTCCGVGDDLDEAPDELDHLVEETSGLDIPESSQHVSTHLLQDQEQTLDLDLDQDYGYPATVDESEVMDITRDDDWLDSPLPLVPQRPSFAMSFNLLPLLANPDPRMRLLFDHCKPPHAQVPQRRRAPH